MPELIKQPPDLMSGGASENEQPELQRQLDERLARTRLQMETLFEKTQETGQNPADVIFADLNDKKIAEEVYGVERISNFYENLARLKYQNKADFIEQTVNVITPFIRDLIFDPEISARAPKIEERSGVEHIQVGTLEAIIHPSQWVLTLRDSEVSAADKVLEISWPDQNGPKGLQDIKESFAEIVKILKEREDIKAVMGTSWMMSRNITSELGFEKFPDIKIEDDKRLGILNLAQAARRDKQYDKGVKQEDVIVGAMSRDEFINRYG